MGCVVFVIYSLMMCFCVFVCFVFCLCLCVKCLSWLCVVFVIYFVMLHEVCVLMCVCVVCDVFYVCV